MDTKKAKELAKRNAELLARLAEIGKKWVEAGSLLERRPKDAK